MAQKIRYRVYTCNQMFDLPARPRRRKSENHPVGVSIWEGQHDVFTYGDDTVAAHDA